MPSKLKYICNIFAPIEITLNKKKEPPEDC